MISQSTELMENSEKIEPEALHPPSIFPVSASIPAPLLMEIHDSVEADTHPASVLTDTISSPAMVPKLDLVPSPNPTTEDFSQHFIHKKLLHEYAQKSRIPLPVYQTVNEGSVIRPTYRSSVLVDEVYYVSPNTFRNRKGAEQDVARIAMEFILKKTKDDGILFIQKDLFICKSVLSEYMVKMKLKKPTYTTNQHVGPFSVFQSSLVFDGVVYTSGVCRSKKEAEQSAARAAIISLLGDVGNPTSVQTLGEIIASKVKQYSTLLMVNDSHPSQMHYEPMVEKTEQHFGISFGANEVKKFVMVNEVESSAIPKVLPMTSPFQPQVRLPKLDAPSFSGRLPIEFVPSNSKEPLGASTLKAKKRSKNKKRANKKLRIDNQLQTNHLSTSQALPSAVAH